MSVSRKFSAIIIASSVSTVVLSGEYSLNGFANLTGGMTLNNDQTYLDYDNHWNMKTDSKVGIQFDADLEGGLNATLQFMARGEDDFSTELEWGYISYELSDSSQIKFGKLRLPIYYYSSSLDVGYSYNWIRPPEDVYSLPISSFEGVDYSTSFDYGQWSLLAQTFYGSNRSELETNGDIDLTQVAGIVLEVEKEWFNFRFSATNGKVDGYSTKSDVNYYSVALSASLDQLTLLSEFTLADVSSSYSSLTADEEINSYLLSSSFTFNQLTPYLSYSSSHAVAPDNFSIYGDIDDKSWIYGIRWDFNPQASLKTEFIDKTDKINAANNSQLASISIDFIF